MFQGKDDVTNINSVRRYLQFHCDCCNRSTNKSNRKYHHCEITMRSKSKYTWQAIVLLSIFSDCLHHCIAWQLPRHYRHPYSTYSSESTCIPLCYLPRICRFRSCSVYLANTNQPVHVSRIFLFYKFPCMPNVRLHRSNFQLLVGNNTFCYSSGQIYCHLHAFPIPDVDNTKSSFADYCTCDRVLFDLVYFWYVSMEITLFPECFFVKRKVQHTK